MTNEQIVNDIAKKVAFVYDEVKDLKGKTLVIFEGMQGTRKSSILKNCLPLLGVPDKLRIDYRNYTNIDVEFQNDVTINALKEQSLKQDIVVMERSIATHIILHDFEVDEDDLLCATSTDIMNRLSYIFDNIVLCDFFTTNRVDEIYDEYLTIKNKRIKEGDFIEKDESIKIWRALHKFNMTDKEIFEQIRLGYVKFFSTNSWTASTKIKRLNMYQ